jgi:homoserine trans-succinylase
VEIKISDSNNFAGLIRNERVSTPLRVKVENNKTIEHESREEPTEKIIMGPRDLSKVKKEKYEYLSKTFCEDLGRPISEEELKDYLNKLESNKTNYWNYLKELKDKTKETVTF